MSGWNAWSGSLSLSSERKKCRLLMADLALITASDVNKYDMKPRRVFLSKRALCSDQVVWSKSEQEVRISGCTLSPFTLPDLDSYWSLIPQQSTSERKSCVSDLLCMFPYPTPSIDCSAILYSRVRSACDHIFNTKPVSGVFMFLIHSWIYSWSNVLCSLPVHKLFYCTLSDHFISLTCTPAC